LATASREHKEQRRRDILEHALTVFSEKGYHAAKVEDIVSRAGVARGTFYLYFEDKRATFAELLDGFVARLRDAILRIDPRAPIREQIRANVERSIDLLVAERGLAKILLSHAQGIDREFDEKLTGFYDAIAHMLERALLLGQRMGIVRPCDARLSAFALLGMVREVVWRIVVGGFDVEREKLTGQLLDQALFGLMTRDEMGGRALGGTAPPGAGGEGGGDGQGQGHEEGRGNGNGEGGGL
jgi:AcrR family transcriptional regulator